MNFARNYNLHLFWRQHILSKIMETNPLIPQYEFENQQTKLGLEIIPLEKVRAVAKRNGYKPHRVNFYQILVVTQGRGIHEVDFEQVAYAENTVIPVAMGQVQRFFDNPETKGYAVLFTPDFMVKQKMDYHFLYDYTLFLNTFKPVGVYAGKEVFALLHEMIAEQEKKDAFDTAAFQRNLLQNFLIQLERTKRQKTQINCTESFNLYLQFRELIEKNINYKLRVADVCDELHVSPKQLNAALQQIIGNTAKQYLEDRVVLEMKRLLAFSSLSVKEIAYEMGFDDPTNFTKYFKSRVNTLPSDYQKQQQA